MTSGLESTERSALVMPVSPKNAEMFTKPQKEIMNSVPHQIILLQNQMQHLQKEFEEMKTYMQKKVTRFTSDIDELKQPLSDAVEDLKK